MQRKNQRGFAVGQFFGLFVLAALPADFQERQKTHRNVRTLFEVFENSPIAWKIGGIPVITILGVIGSIFTLFLFYRLFVDNYYGANKPFTLWLYTT